MYSHEKAMKIKSQLTRTIWKNLTNKEKKPESEEFIQHESIYISQQQAKINYYLAMWQNYQEND